jgi:hypothetical protein
VHRLDLDTAGLVLFTTRIETRAHYHRLLPNDIEREIGGRTSDVPPDARIGASKTESRPANLVFAASRGEVNAITEIECLDSESGLGLGCFPRQASGINYGFIWPDRISPCRRSSSQDQEKQYGDPPLQLQRNAWYSSIHFPERNASSLRQGIFVNSRFTRRD